MILAALTVATALTGPIPVAATGAYVLPTPNLYRTPAVCGEAYRQVVERQREELRKLGQLPNGIAQYAVDRWVGGCPVPAPVGYHPGYLLPGVAQPAPVTREDAPSNRR